MPLARVQVRNEFGLGQPELYTEVDREDPKAVLDGLAVAGLVGILRQLGDLAEFAADIFHGLQEEVMNTCSRSHKLKVHVQRIEATLPPLEKAILAQKSHLHLAYTTGSDWHARFRNERNHFISGDLPHFIMDCYEECRDPPRLNLLDKFDSGGPGTCLKRYSDPTFFRRLSTIPGEANVEKFSKERKSSRSKKKRTRKRKEVRRAGSISNLSGRTQFASFGADSHLSPSQTASSCDGTFKPHLIDQSISVDSRAGSGYIECVFHPTYSMKSEEYDHKESPISSSRMQYDDTLDSASLHEHSTRIGDIVPSLSQDQSPPSSSCVTWDEKMEILEAEGYQYDHEESTERLPMNSRVESQVKGAADFRNTDYAVISHRENPEKNADDSTSESQEKGAADFRNTEHKFISLIDSPEKEANDSRSVAQMDLQFDDQDKPTSVCVQNQVDDCESEPENFEDALNTIESESETDLDCQTKREVDHSNSNDNGIPNEIHVVAADHWKFQPSNMESQVSASNASSKEVSVNEPDVMLPRYIVLEKSSHMGGESFATSNSMHEKKSTVAGSDIDSSGTLPYSHSAESSPQQTRADEAVTNSYDSEKSSSVPSGIQPVAFWTNGGLLGLEPSKPPDFGVPNAAKKDVVTSNEGGTGNLSSHGNKFCTDRDVRKSNSLFECIASEISSRNNDRDGISVENSSQRFSPTDLDAKREKYGNSASSNSFYRDRRHSSGETFAETPDSRQIYTPDAKSISNGARQKGDENASLLFGIGNRFSLNSSQRNLSLPSDDKSEAPSSRVTDAFETSKNQSVAYKPYSDKNLKGYLGSGSLLYSPSSSPPLQHMKISVQPVNGCDTSKLKLQFPDGSYCEDGSGDMLLSFQLVPESSTHQHDNYSDSDDDTFCRSSPYMSDDDRHSHHSESNSDQWESDYTPSNENDLIYDSFRKPSSTDSVLRSSDIEGAGCEIVHFGYGQYSESGSQPCQSGHSVDLPSLSTVNPLFEQEMGKSFDARDLQISLFSEELEPLPPPLPPAQWCVAKTPSEVNASKKDSVSEATSHVSDMKIMGSTIPLPPQSKPSPDEKPTETDKAVALKQDSKQQSEWQKSNGGREASKAVDRRGSNEKDDFLHQIRTKAFSLRRTMTDRPAVTPPPTANDQVTAILEKANAIRQAVGSDNGDDEDDNWSE